MPTVHPAANLSVEHNALTHETVEDVSSDEDASLASWLSIPQAAEQWWAAAAAGSRGELPSLDWLTDRMAPRTAIAVTIRPVESSHEPADDLVSLAVPEQTAHVDAWENIASSPSPAAAQSETDIPLWPQLDTQDRVAAAAGDDAHVPAFSHVHLDAALEGIWPQVDRIAHMTDDELEPFHSGPAQDEDSLHDEAIVRDSGATGEHVVVVNVTGLDEMEMADIAAGEYEAAQARRRFRAHVPG